MSLAAITPQLFSEKFSAVSAGLREKKVALLVATTVGICAYPLLLSRLNANRFVCLSLALLPPLLTAEWSVRRYQKKSVQQVADSIWMAETPPALPIANQLRVVELLRQRVEKEAATPASVVYFLLHANGWSDLASFTSVVNRPWDSNVVKMALQLSVFDDQRIKVFKNGYAGRPNDTIEVLAKELSLEKQFNLDLVQDACTLLANHRKWYNMFERRA